MVIAFSLKDLSPIATLMAGTLVFCGTVRHKHEGISDKLLIDYVQESGNRFGMLALRVFADQVLNEMIRRTPEVI